MPVFVYRAADRRGQTIDGVMEAPDARAVIERLQRDAYFPIRVAPHAERAGWLSFGGASRVSQRDLLAFTQQLATLFESGLPLDRGLSILEELAPNPRVQGIVTDLLVRVRGGSPGIRPCWDCRSPDRSSRKSKPRASRVRSAPCSRAACRSWAPWPSWATR